MLDQIEILLHSAENNSLHDNAKARWVSMPNATPYVGNDICPFENWDRLLVDGKFKDSKFPDKIQHCSTLKYKPFPGYEAPDPNLIFEYLPSGATIYFIGDSITRQAGLDFACQLYAISSTYEEAKNKSTRHNKEITFTSPDGKKNIVFKLVRDTHVKTMIPYLQATNKGDVFIMNQGAHFLGDKEIPGYQMEDLLNELKEQEPAFKEAMGRGVMVAWRETNAGRFMTEDGYWNKDIGEKQSKKLSVTCVNPEELNAPASFSRCNEKVNPVVKSIGVPIIDFWKSSVLLPSECYKGQVVGGDCLHFIIPGGTSHITENILNFIYSNMAKSSVE